MATIKYKNSFYVKASGGGGFPQKYKSKKGNKTVLFYQIDKTSWNNCDWLVEGVVKALRGSMSASLFSGTIELQICPEKMSPKEFREHYKSQVDAEGEELEKAMRDFDKTSRFT